MTFRTLDLGDLKIFVIRALTDNYVYLLRYKAHRDLIVIDPSVSQPVFDFLTTENFSLSWILNTHHHHDHVGGNHELKKKFGCQIVCSVYDQSRVPDADSVFVDGVQSFLDLNITAIPVPGHTLGHTALYLRDYSVLFSGDTLFSLGCGRLFEGTHEQLFQSLQKIKALPADTLVLCGHEYTQRNAQFTLKYENDEVIRNLAAGHISMPTTLEWEMKHNLFLKASSVERFRELRTARDEFTSY